MKCKCGRTRPWNYSSMNFAAFFGLKAVFAWFFPIWTCNCGERRRGFRWGLDKYGL